MAKGFGERVGRMGLIAGGAFAASLLVEHLVIPAVFGGPSLEDTLASRVDSVAVGQPFNHDNIKNPGGGLRLEHIKAPGMSAVGAGWYNAYENNGAHDPTDPGKRLHAAVTCATLVLNGGKLSKGEVEHWSTAQRNNGQNGDHNLAQQEYDKAAAACTADVAALLDGPHPAAEIVIPVAQD